MPRGDGNGPWWAGGVWGCRRWQSGAGYGRGFGFGGGFGRRSGFAYAGQAAAPATQQAQFRELEAYAEELMAELEAIKKRMAGLKKGE